MKKYAVIPGLTCILAASAMGCSGEAELATDPPTNADQQPQLAAPIGAPIAAAPIALAAPLAAGAAPIGAAFSVWPMGPIVLNGLAATMPLAVWSNQPIGLLAFNLAGVTDLSVSLATSGAGGVLSPVAGCVSAPISAPFLAGITAGLGTPFLGGAAITGGITAGLAAAPALLPTAAPLGAWNLSPACTNSALMFTGLPALSGIDPFIVNIGFTWPASLSFAGLSVFSASTAATSAFTSAAVATSAANTLAFQSAVFPLNFIGGVDGMAPMLVW